MSVSANRAAKQGSVGVQVSAQQRGLFLRLLVLGGVVMLVSQIVISWIALQGFEDDLKPELNRKAIAVGRALTSELSYAINDLGIPPSELVGVDEYFRHILDANTDIQFLALVDGSSRLMYERNLPQDLRGRLKENAYDPRAPAQAYWTGNIGKYIDSGFPIYSNGNLNATLHVGVSGDNVRRQLATVLYEIIAVIIVSMVITLEFLMMFMSLRILDPTAHIQKVLEAGSKGEFTQRVFLRARNEIGLMVSNLNRLMYHLEQRYLDFQFELRELRDAQIDPLVSQKIAMLKTQANRRYWFSDRLGLVEKTPSLIRVPFFLFIFSEELSRSFFPLFVGSFIPIEPVFSYEVMISLPITLFMAAIFVATLFAGKLTQRLGSSRLFLAGICCAFVGYCGTYFSDSYTELILWRCLNGIGYGLIFNACETWVALYAKETNRAYSASAFVGAIFAGYVCGPSMGGMFADYVGQQMTFLISAGLSVVSGLVAYQLLRDLDAESNVKPIPSPESKATGLEPWKILFGNARFIGTVLTAVPTRATLSAFLFFLVPLYLNHLGHSNTEIGQMMMLYGVLIVVGTPVIARLADHTRRYVTFTVAGASLSGLGLFAGMASGLLGGESRAVLIAIIAVGTGHCLVMSPLYAIMQQIIYSYRDQIEIPVAISIYRFVDRIGLVIGPLLAALLVQQLSYPGAMATIGGLVILAVLLTLVAINADRRRVPGGVTA